MVKAGFSCAASADAENVPTVSSMRGSPDVTAPCAQALPGLPIPEAGGDPALVLLETRQDVPGVNSARTERRQDRAIEDQMQFAAMNRVLRNRVTGRNSARLLPDALAFPVVQALFGYRPGQPLAVFPEVGLDLVQLHGCKGKNWPPEYPESAQEEMKLKCYCHRLSRAMK